MTLVLVWCALSCLSAYGFHRYKRWRHEREVQAVIAEIERLVREREGVMRALDRSRLRQHSWRAN